MSRTKRYVPHHVKRDALHPHIDPQTLKPYMWATPERTQYYDQRQASRLRGNDGKNPHYRNRWCKDNEKSKHQREFQTKETHIALGEHYDDWWQDWLDANDAWYDDTEDEYLRMIEEEEEMLRELEREERERGLDDYYDTLFYEEPWDEMY